MLVASLLKYEGLGLAAAAVAVLCSFDRDILARAGRWRLGLVFAPAVLHQLWGYAIGLRGDFSGIRWLEVWRTLPDRAGVIGQAAVDVLGRTPILLEGALGALAAIVILAAGPKIGMRRNGVEGSCLIIAAVWAAWVFLLFFFTPRDLPWHLNNALDRLLLHPAALALVALLSLLRDTSEDEAGTRGPST